MTDHKRRVVKVTRDGILFVVGLAGIFHETLINNAERPSLLILFGGMVGLPVFLRSDEKDPNDDAGKPKAE